MDKNRSGLALNPSTGGTAFFAMIALYVLISFFGQAICAAIFPDGGAAYIAICSTFAAISMLAVVSFFVMKSDGNAFTVMGVGKFDLRALLLALMLSAGMFFGLGFVNSAFVALLEKLGASVSATQIPLDSVGQVIGFTVILAFLPAFLEEIFFRGLLLGSLKKTGLVCTIIAVSVCFALYHCSAAQLVYQLIYGAGLTLLAIVAKSVIPCMVAHFLNNFIVIILEYTGVNVNLFNPLVIAVGVVLLVGFFALSVLSLKKYKNTEVYKKTESVKGFYLPFGCAGLIICAVILIGGLFLGA